MQFDPPPLYRLESNWVPPWLILRLIQHGPQHLADGLPMDDGHAVGAVGGTFWLIAADGVGTQPNSRHGARLCCSAMNRHLGEHLSDGTPPSTSLLLDAFRAARTAIEAEALLHNAPLETFATTLSAALVADDGIYAATVGDSGAVLVTDGIDDEGVTTLTLAPLCSAIQPPMRGTYSMANAEWETACATSTSRNGNAKMVIVATDGANRFFLDPKAPDTFNQRWPSFLERGLEQTGPRLLTNMLALFTNESLEKSPEVQDDRTLLVAFRPAGRLAPPAPQPR